MINKVLYLGPTGSYSEIAKDKFKECFASECEFIALESIYKIIRKLQELDSEDVAAVIPIENSIEGIVRETIDNMLRLEDSKIRIQGEISLPIKHLLLAKTTDKTQIKKIISHLQALAQCGKYLYKNFSDAELKEVSSTSYAAQKVSQDGDMTVAAIANETCAKLFDLNILDIDLNDEKDNKTRFYLLGRNEIEKVNNNGKTAIVLSTKNKSGALCDVLQIFAKHEINLTYIDSRPSKRKLGEYLFFMELDGFESDYKIKMALEELMSYVDFIRVLGSFCIYE